MSAWTVSKAHIDLLINAALRRRPGGADYGFSWWNGQERINLEEIGHSAAGQMLWDENFTSVNSRYQEENGAPAYNFKQSFQPTDPVVVLKQISCFEYQSCEHDGWEKSEAKAFCDALRSKQINRLPGYDDAPWGVDDKPGEETMVVILSDLVTTRIWDTSDPAVKEVKPDDDENNDTEPLFDF